MRKFWASIRSWGLLNFTWGIDGKWGMHILCFHRDQWYWGYSDEEYDCAITYWGAGPLGFVSRLNILTDEVCLNCGDPLRSRPLGPCMDDRSHGNAAPLS